MGYFFILKVLGYFIIFMYFIGQVLQSFTHIFVFPNSSVYYISYFHFYWELCNKSFSPHGSMK